MVDIEEPNLKVTTGDNSFSFAVYQFRNYHTPHPEFPGCSKTFFIAFFHQNNLTPNQKNTEFTIKKVFRLIVQVS